MRVFCKVAQMQGVKRRTLGKSISKTKATTYRPVSLLPMLHVGAHGAPAAARTKSSHSLWPRTRDTLNLSLKLRLRRVVCKLGGRIRKGTNGRKQWGMCCPQLDSIEPGRLPGPQDPVGGASGHLGRKRVHCIRRQDPPRPSVGLPRS